MLEGTIQGRERCAPTGIEYAFEGHFFGVGSVTYLAWVIDSQDRVIGSIQGELTCAKDDTRSEVRLAVESAVRRTLATGTFTARAG